MDSSVVLLIASGLAGGFISGLSGFGAGLVALPLLLQVTPATIAAQLAAMCGMIGQIQTLRSLRRTLRWQRLVPVALAGVTGVAIGIWWVPHLPIAVVKVGVGTILIAYALFALALPDNWRFYRWHLSGDLLTGLAGGLTGGIAGIPGPPIVMWAAVQHLSSDDKRSMIQIFNLVTLSFMLLASAGSGLLTRSFFGAAAVVLPATMVGTIVGAAIYRRLNDMRYQQLVIVLLLVSGLAMVVAR